MGNFDVNVLSSKPVIREAANMQNDGGAGNLGYMQQGDGDNEKKRHQSSESIFAKKEYDTFVLSKNLKEKDVDKSLLEKLLDRILDIIQKILG